MAFSDHPLIAGLVSKAVSGLAVSKTAAMTLEVATGSVVTHDDGATHTLAAAESNAFAADNAKPTNAFVGLISDGVNVDVWFDSYVDTGKNKAASIPAGYKLVAELAWFTIPAGETDLANVTIHRRVWL